MPGKRKKPLVFISHKEEDKRLALAVKEFVIECTANQVDLFVSSDYESRGVRPGHSIVGQLTDALKQAELVILVYTKPTHDWAYCMWECGVARGSRELKQKEIIVLQCIEGAQPRLFEGQLAVKAWEQDSVRVFARMFLDAELFPSRLEPITTFEKETLDKKAIAFHSEMSVFLKDIAQAEPTPIRVHPSVRVSTTIPDPTNGETFPDLSMVVADEWSARELFGLPEVEETWGSLQCRLKHENDELVTELQQGTREFREYGRLTPLTAIFTAQDKRRYRPVLLSMEITGGGAVTYELLFLTLPPASTADIPEETRKLFTRTPARKGMRAFNNQLSNLTGKWRLTWYGMGKVLVAERAELFLFDVEDRFRGEVQVTHRLDWDRDMSCYALEGQLSATGEFIFTYWNLYGSTLCGGAALKRNASGMILTGNWVGFTAERAATSLDDWRGAIRMCRHELPEKVSEKTRKNTLFRECPQCVKAEGSLLPEVDN